MIDNTKTIWQCPACHKDGCVHHQKDEGILNVVAKIVRQHETSSPLCTQQFDKLQVKLWE